MKELYIAHAQTEAGDSYYYLFNYKPTREEVQTLVWEEEGKTEDLEYYLELTSVEIINPQLRTKE